MSSVVTNENGSSLKRPAASQDADQGEAKRAAVGDNKVFSTSGEQVIKRCVVAGQECACLNSKHARTLIVVGAIRQLREAL